METRDGDDGIPPIHRVRAPAAMDVQIDKTG